MFVRVAVAVVVLLSLVSPVGATRSPAESPEIVAVYPNPAAPNDDGEFVVVSFPRRTNVSGWTLGDDEATVRLPNDTVSGTVAFSTSPSLTRTLTPHRVFPLPDSLALADEGETVVLRNGGAVDSVAYSNAPEGECWRPSASAWRPLGATDRPVAHVDAATARAFALPDAPDVPIEVLRSAEERVMLAGYSFTSRRAADELAAAAERGVDVHVLVEAAPVGGISRREARTLDRLAERGVTVEVIGGERARYRFHHAKYAVADDRAVVLTENWKPSGTGGHGSRGWGVVVRGRAADELAGVFRADASWEDTTPWRRFRRGKTFQPSDPADGSFPRTFHPRSVSVESVTVLVAPDNAEEGVVSLLDSADESILVQQLSIGGPRQPFVQATLDAARRGVEVRVLLSGAWYVRDDNRRVAEWLNDRAAAENLPLEAKVDEADGYEKIHTKGVVVDEERVLVGSLNWNNNSARENREVAVVLHGEEAGEYYADVFRADWGERRPDFPLGLVAVVGAGVGCAVWLARREVRFEGETRFG